MGGGIGAGGSGISVGGGSGGGVIPDDTGWIYLPGVGLAGVSAYEITGIPDWANEIAIFLNGVSISTSGQMQLQGSANGVYPATTVYGYRNEQIGGSTAGGGNNTVSALHLTSQLTSSNFISGYIQLNKESDSSWAVTSGLFDAASRQSQTSGLFSGLPTILTGVRFSTNAGTFDNGFIRAAYRR